MKKKFILLCIVFAGFAVKAQSLYFPPLTGNAWDSIVPASIGYCQPRIDSLYNYLQANHTKSFLILKNGKRVLEKYFGTYTQDSLFYWASASKSLAGFITGIAQQKGFININNPVSQYLGNGWSDETVQKENLVTVKHLLSMSGGLDDAPPSPCTNEDTAKACLIYKADAGTRWSYHTGAYKKVQDVVSHAAGQNYNIITNNWVKTHIGMSGTWFQQTYYSKARDMARFGLLSLNKGIWSADTLLKDSLYFKDMISTSQSFNLSYGYLWWLNGKASCMVPGYQTVFPVTLVPNAPANMYCALGKNDQKIYVVPGQDLVIIRQGNAAGANSLALSDFDNVLWDYINKLTCTTTGFKNNLTAQYRMYPNPANERLTIEDPASGIQSIRICDLFGKTMLLSDHDSKTGRHDIDLSALAGGVYLIELEDADGNKVRHKLVKE